MQAKVHRTVLVISVFFELAFSLLIKIMLLSSCCLITKCLAENPEPEQYTFVSKEIHLKQQDICLKGVCFSLNIILLILTVLKPSSNFLTTVESISEQNLLKLTPDILKSAICQWKPPFLNQCILL